MARQSINRRQFIVSGAAGVLGVSAAFAWGSKALAGTRSGQVSILESFAPPEWRQAFAETVAQSGHGADRLFWSAFTGNRIGTDPAPANELQLLTLPAPGVESLEPSDARRIAAISNDRLAEEVRKQPGRAGLGSLSAYDPDAVREAERAIHQLGLAGLSLGVNRGMRLDHRQLWPVYEFAEAASVPIYLPAGYSTSAGDGPYRQLGRAGIVAGASADSSAHAVQLMFGGVLDAFPRLNVILARLGEATPYWYTEFTAIEASLVHGAPSRPRRTVRDYFRDNIHLTTADMQSPATLQFCSTALGRPNTLMGGGYRMPGSEVLSDQGARLWT